MTLSDSLNFRRIQNSLACWSGYQLTRLTGKYLPPPLPVTLAIEPTTSCNLRCPECPSGLRSFTRDTGMISPELFRDIINQVSPHCAYLTFYFQGEPFLHPEFTEMLRYAHQKRIYTVTSTNAHFLDDQTCDKICDSGLGKLIVSLDGISKESYLKYRIGGDLQRVILGIQNLIRIRKQKRSGPRIILQFLVMKHNAHEIQEAKQRCREWGADEIVFKTVQINNTEDHNGLVPDTDALSRYSKKGGLLSLNNAMEDRCWKLWSSAVITWDGKVLPCCFDKDASHVMGDLRSNSFAEIWQGGAYHNFRKKLLNGRKEIDICKNCSEGSRVSLPL